MQSISEFRPADMSLYKEPQNRCKCGAGDHCVRVERISGGHVGTCICGAQRVDVRVDKLTDNRPPKIDRRRSTRPKRRCVDCGVLVSNNSERCKSHAQLYRFGTANTARTGGGNGSAE